MPPRQRGFVKILSVPAAEYVCADLIPLCPPWQMFFLYGKRHCKGSPVLGEGRTPLAEIPRTGAGAGARRTSSDLLQSSRDAAGSRTGNRPLRPRRRLRQGCRQRTDRGCCQSEHFPGKNGKAEAFRDADFLRKNETDSSG